METPQHIVNAIKAIRSSTKRGDELAVYQLAKKEYQLITMTDIYNTLKILSEMGRIEKKLSKDISSYFLIDNNIIDSQPLIPTIIATPLVKASSFTDVLFVSVEDQIDFLVSDIENVNNNSLETLDVIDNASKYVKEKN